MKLAVFYYLLLFSSTSIAFDTYCHDKETNAYWDALAIEYVDRMDVTNLVKLRKQLCRQIDTGEISVYDATKIFERERASVVEGLEKGKF